MDLGCLQGSLNLFDFFKTLKYKINFNKNNPDFFHPCGLLVFTGPQGSGKTISAVQYITKLSYMYPKCIICTNTEIKSLNPDSVVIEYDGIDCLKNIENGVYGVIYYIDEIHLEFNSLESKNIPIDIMTEISQQRKQRKHIIGTSQVYGRMAKALREQIKNVVICNNYFSVLQRNVVIDGDSAVEVDGELKYNKVKTFFWFHSPKLYESYNTYAKMKRYRNEWNGVRREVSIIEHN